MAKAKSWREAGCYVHRARKPGAWFGLPFIGRHTVYVGETSSRFHRDRQHLYGGGTYGATAKMYSDLDVKIYPLPCPFPNWAWSRKAMETVWIGLLWPVYNVQKNKWNPRRIKPRTAERQRWARHAARDGRPLALYGRRMARGAVVWGFWAVVIWGGVSSWTQR